MREPLYFLGNVAPGVAEVGSTFLRLQASIWESRRKRVQRAVARAWLACQHVKKTYTESTEKPLEH